MNINEAQLIGYGIIVIISLGSFVAVIQKFTQPINDLRIVIQKLNDKIDVLTSSNADLKHKLEQLREDAYNMEKRIHKLETRMEVYHKE